MRRAKTSFHITSRKTLLFVCFIGLSQLANAQFTKLFETEESSTIESGIIQKGNLIMVGSTIVPGLGDYNGHLIKTDTLGNLIWSRSIGGAQDDFLTKLEALEGGSYIATGHTNSYGNGGEDGLVIRYDENDEAEWSNTFGGSEDERIYVVKEVEDGNILLGGWTTSYGAGGQDVMLVKVDPNGNELWMKVIGNSGDDRPNFANIVHRDGKYIVAGTWTRDIAIPGLNGFIIELDPNGELLSSDIYGANNDDVLNGYSMFTDESEHILFGESYSFNGTLRIWMSRLGANRHIEFNKTYGIAGIDIQYSCAISVNANQIVVAGHEFTEGQSSASFLLNVNQDGTVNWSNTYDNVDNQHINDIISDQNGNFFGVGYGEVDGKEQMLIIKAANSQNGGCGDRIQIVEGSFEVRSESFTPDTLSVSTRQNLMPAVEELTIVENVLCNASIKAEFSAPDSVCTNECIAITETSFENVTNWEWQFTGAENNISTIQNPEICFVEDGLQHITLIVSNDFTSDTLTRMINILPLPSIKLPTDINICPDETLTVPTEISQADSISWSNGQETPNVTVQSPGNYYVTAKNKCGNTQDSMPVDLILPPVVQLGNDTILCEKIGLTISINPDPNTTYSWNDGFSTIFKSIDTSGYHTITASNKCGVAKDSILVSFYNLNDLMIPNAFSPNGDGINEHFEIDERIVGAAMRIVDRNGKILFESNDYQNNWGGEELPAGTYYYILEDRCFNIHKGWLQIVR